MAVVQIATAFPNLRTRHLENVLYQRGLHLDSPIADISQTAGPGALYGDIARLIIDEAAGVELGQSLPGLAALGASTISPQSLSTRSYNALSRGQRGTAPSWADLAALTPDTLFSFKNLGMTSIVDIVATAAEASIGALASGLVVDETPADAGALPPNARGSTIILTVSEPERGEAWSSLATLSQWAREITGAKDIQAALSDVADRESALPEDVATAWQVFLETPLSEVAGVRSFQVLDHVLAEIDELLGDERRSQIFWARIDAHPPTLEVLGEQTGVTRERVRQIQTKVEGEVRALLASAAYGPIRWRSVELARQLGIAFPVSATPVEDAFNALGVGSQGGSSGRVRTLLLWLAGPYRPAGDGWMKRADVPAPRIVDGAVDEVGRLDVELLRSWLTAAGLTKWAAEAWMQSHVAVRRFDGVPYRWHGSVADKAATVLAASGEPATAEAITDAIGEGHDIRGTRNRLLEDARFKRVDRVRIGLREWDFDEYTGIVDEIGEEIERRGGDADVRLVIATVATTYAVKPGSVEAYTAVPRFVIDGRTIRLRREDDPYQSRRQATDESRVDVLDSHRCAYRLKVDRELLCGSGRSLPEGLGVWLGVLPGGRRVVTIESDEVPVTWPDSSLYGPAVGSLRRTALSLGAEASDQLVLVFNRDTSEAHTQLVRPRQLASITPLGQLSLLTAVVAGPDFEDRFSKAIGGGGESDVRYRLRSRGEEDLLALLPDRDVDLTDALDRLRRVL